VVQIILMKDTYEIYSDPKNYEDKWYGKWRNKEKEIIRNILEGIKYPCILIDMGAGPGKEIEWFYNIKNIKEIWAIDKNKLFIEYLKNKRYPKTKVIEADFTIWKPEKEDNYVIICLNNTFGNFYKEERKSILKLWKSYAKKIILSLTKYKDVKSYDKMIETLSSYAYLDFVWDFAIKKYGKIPNFWFDSKNRDVIIWVDDYRFISHRWTIEDIKEEFPNAKIYDAEKYFIVEID